MKNSMRFLILEDDPHFRTTLEGICMEMGPTVSTAHLGTAVGYLSEHSFDLLLLDWPLHQNHPSPFYDKIRQFQPQAHWLALFTEPDLTQVVAAMKAGAKNVLWSGEGRNALAEKIGDFNKGVWPSFSHRHSFVSELADLLSEKAVAQKLSLVKARKEFFKAFIGEILQQKSMPKAHLASFVNVSPRTLYRHMTPDKK